MDQFLIRGALKNLRLNLLSSIAEVHGVHPAGATGMELFRERS
jgi:hypothetical protein